MTITPTRTGKAGSNLAFASILAGALFAASSAFAAGCPTGKISPDVRAPEMTKGKDVTDSVLSTVDLSKEMVKLEHRHLRLPSS